jgi:hypothetical protein
MRKGFHGSRHRVSVKSSFESRHMQQNETRLGPRLGVRDDLGVHAERSVCPPDRFDARPDAT